MANKIREKKPASYALDPEVLERLEQWISRQTLKPTKVSVMNLAITRFLDSEEVPHGKRK